MKRRNKILFPVICILTALIPILIPTIANGGFYHIADDMDNQMLPFLFNFKHAFDGGLNTYMWNFDLGTPMAYAYGYYGLGSIFFYPALILPSAVLLKSISIIFLLKYLLACYGALFYLRRYTKTDYAAMAGAILYAFSGLQSTNLPFYIFHDVTAVFPFLLITLDMLIDEEQGKKVIRSGILFSLAVFVNCATNYVFFVQSVIAIIIYFLFRTPKKLKIFMNRMLRSIGFGTIGVGLSGIIFIPSIIYIMGNERSTNTLADCLYLYDYKHILYILKGFLFPPDSMLDEAVLMIHEWSSTSCYLPFVGLILVFVYLMKNRNWLSAMTVFLFAISFLPAGNGAFLMFTIVYHRWWYFLILIMALESVLVLENVEDYRLGIPAALQILLTLLVTGLIWIYRENGESLVFHRGRFLIQAAFIVGTTLAVLVLTKLREKKCFIPGMFAGIILCSVITFIFTQNLYISEAPVNAEAYENLIEAEGQIPESEDNYRFRNYVNTLIMYNGSRNVTGLSSYSSTTSLSIVEFDELFDYWDVSRRTNKNFIPGVAQLLGGKYMVTTDNKVEERYPDSTLAQIEAGTPIKSFEVDGKAWNVYELDACPIGYSVDRVITESELRSLPVDQRGIALLYAPVVKDEALDSGMAVDRDDVIDSARLDVVTAADVTGLIGQDAEHITGDALFDNACIDALTQENSSRSVGNFTKGSRSFSADTDYDQDTYAYFTIPYDMGWKITVDGTPVKAVSSGGMTLIPVNAGTHHIEAVYHLPWLGTGIIVSVVSLIILIALGLLHKIALHN